MLLFLRLKHFLTLCTITISGNRHLTTVFNDQAEIQGRNLMPPPFGGSIHQDSLQLSVAKNARCRKPTRDQIILSLSLSLCSSRARTLNLETLNQSLLKVPAKRRRRHGTEPTQIGGILKDNGVGHVSRPFVGVLAGVLYNGMRPLDLAAVSTDSSSSSSAAAAKRRGRGTSTAIGDVR